MWSNNSCLIWNTPALAQININDLSSKWISPRVRGGYAHSREVEHQISNLANGDKVKLTSWLIEQRSFGIQMPTITGEVISKVKQRRISLVNERTDKILKFLEDNSPSAGRHFSIPWLVNIDCALDLTKLESKYKKHLDLLCHSESVDSKELVFLFDYLKASGYIKFSKHGGEMSFELTVKGYQRLEVMSQRNTESSTAFVAMWFDDSLREAWEKGFEPAITDAGYNPVRVDQIEHIDRIDDRIIAAIRRSRFIVADFTHGKFGTKLPPEKCGARGGVYYEAGYAHGLGIHVIFTCRKDLIEHVHFDTRQYNHIVWENPDELRTALTARIAAVVGDGPLKQVSIATTHQL